MVSALLPFIIIAVSFSKFSQAALPATYISEAGHGLMGFVANPVHPNPSQFDRVYIPSTAPDRAGAAPLSPPELVTIAPHPTIPMPPHPGKFYNVKPRLIFPDDPKAPPPVQDTPTPPEIAPSYHSTRPLHVVMHSLKFPPTSHDYFEAPPHSQVGSLEEYFSGRPALREVALEQQKAITEGVMTPISAENQKLWRKQSVGYLSLEPEHQAEIRFWLESHFHDGHRDPKYRTRVIAHIWSLMQSGRKNSIWWPQSLIDSADPKHNGYIDIIQAGDLLKFFDRRADFKISDQQVTEILPQLTKILYLGEDEQPRTEALDIEKLMAFKDRDNVPMYQSRVGYIMKVSLRRFFRRDQDQRERILQDLNLVVGSPPSQIIQSAKNALIKDRHSFFNLLTPKPKSAGQDDYARIEAELAKLGKA
ncbi:hypothetical protein PGT21_019817 [Puccinia graminis f. sp. tritici]|uniref:Uncharacterized protein n=1 Tax=Puccinia graminis f. sp. tritici TaxID=56615 RepID=A0A5B0SDP8_PUCGR|nr:hypothetical protein PGT21_019817 [Puccinia graminis f. sp. tritici]KAA1136206.1 hypothetical protein PGTUg99_035089 [Puccinia graminis f. sp. tritici]